MQILVKDLEKQYDGTDIQYEDMSFESNKSYLILGPSGCGKSTYLNMLAGIVKPTKGSIYVDDFNILEWTQSRLEKYRLCDIGYIYQDFKLIDELTVQDNIELLSIEGKLNRTAKEVTELVGLGGKLKQKCCKLSGGEKQRVAVARALVKQPKLLLADEPTGNLNYEIGKSIIELLCNNRSDILIVVTHDTRLKDYFDVVLNFEELVKNRGC